jgi:hypothetical protein
MRTFLFKQSFPYEKTNENRAFYSLRSQLCSILYFFFVENRYAYCNKRYAHCRRNDNRRFVIARAFRTREQARAVHKRSGAEPFNFRQKRNKIRRECARTRAEKHARGAFCENGEKHRKRYYPHAEEPLVHHGGHKIFGD